MSLIRITGLLLSVLIFILIAHRLRSHAIHRLDVWGLTFVGTGLILVSLFPGLVNLPAELFLLDDIKGGRITTILVLSNVILFTLLFSYRNTQLALKYQLDRHIQASLANEVLHANHNVLQPTTILILIPAYMEADNLKKILPGIPKQLNGRKIKALVINDGSSDNTEQVAKKSGALIVNHPYNRGGGAALRTGYAIAERAGTEILVTMDGDGQHNPDEIKTLIEPILKNTADFVIGSRMLGSHDNYSGVRIRGVYIFNKFINLLMGTNITDCASGFRAIRFSALGRINLRQDQYHTSELIIEAAKKGLRITERPIHISARLSGTSKKGHDIFYGIGFLRAIMTTWWR